MRTYDAYVRILRRELVPAMGCTEPIAVAYAAAKAKETLGRRPDSLEMICSANIVKNVKSVTVPNTGGLKGIAAAAVAGAVGGDSSRELEVLQSLKPEQHAEISRLLAASFCRTSLAEGREGLYIEAVARSGKDFSRVVIEHSHTGISKIEKNGEVLFEAPRDIPEASLQGETAEPEPNDYALLNVRDILRFAETFNLDDLAGLIREQIRMNSAISDEGLAGDYGVSVGKTLLKYRGDDIRIRARARAAAGSDARMAGCALPVIINSGSGNQGITVSVPVIEYADFLGCDEEKLIRALVISNLISLQQKDYIGKLSAYCGAVSAAVGSAAAIAWLKGGSYEQVAATIINAIATADGILCDGAKSSCAAKIATALEAAIMAHEIGMEEGKKFAQGEGLVGVDVEETIRNIGRVGSVGMRPTDVEIINLMLQK